MLSQQSLYRVGKREVMHPDCRRSYRAKQIELVT
jgi:hypothetical protein